nr:uncharacterized protein LOC113459668 [Zonotrichia albicollis]
MLAGAQRNSSLQCGWEGKKEYKKNKKQSRPSPSAIGILRVPPAGQPRRALPARPANTHGSSSTGLFQQPGLALQVETGPRCPQRAALAGRKDRNLSQSWAGAQGAHGAAQRATAANLHLHHARTPQWAEDCINSTLSCCVQLQAGFSSCCCVRIHTCCKNSPWPQSSSRRQQQGSIRNRIRAAPAQEGGHNRDSAQGLLRTMPCLGVLAFSPETPAQSPRHTRPLSPSAPAPTPRSRRGTEQPQHNPKASSELTTPQTRREPTQPWCQCGGTHGLGFLSMLHCFSLENCSSSQSLPFQHKGNCT